MTYYRVCDFTTGTGTGTGTGFGERDSERHSSPVLKKRNLLHQNAIGERLSGVVKVNCFCNTVDLSMRTVHSSFLFDP